MRHFAATPVGLRVTATAEVTAVDGRTISFRVEARDERETIGDGTHQRVVVNVARFDERVQRKLGGAELTASGGRRRYGSSLPVSCLRTLPGSAQNSRINR